MSSTSRVSFALSSKRANLPLIRVMSWLSNSRAFNDVILAVSWPRVTGSSAKKNPVEVAPQESEQDVGGSQVIVAGREFPEILAADLPTVTGRNGVAGIILPTKPSCRSIVALRLQHRLSEERVT